MTSALTSVVDHVTDLRDRCEFTDRPLTPRHVTAGLVSWKSSLITDEEAARVGAVVLKELGLDSAAQSVASSLEDHKAAEGVVNAIKLLCTNLIQDQLDHSVVRQEVHTELFEIVRQLERLLETPLSLKEFYLEIGKIKEKVESFGEILKELHLSLCALERRCLGSAYAARRDTLGPPNYQTSIHSLVPSHQGVHFCIASIGGMRVGFHLIDITNLAYLQLFSNTRLRTNRTAVSQFKEAVTTYQQAEGQDITPLLSINLPRWQTDNCMSFGVGRKASQILMPGGKSPLSNNNFEVVKCLEENGCINITTLGFDLVEDSWKDASSLSPTYLAAFVSRSKGSDNDFHVYRCFCNPLVKDGLIWMELVVRGGGVQFSSKGGARREPILGLPQTPEEYFCKSIWDTFLGYYLVPPGAIFKVVNARSKREEKANLVL